MAASPTVLDWDDITVLVGLCTSPNLHDNNSEQRLERARHALVDALRTFLQVWRPGQMMDNSFRRPLIEALDEFTTAWEDFSQRTDVVNDSTADIRKRLTEAIETAEAMEAQSPSKEHPGLDGTLSILLLIALQQLSSWPNG